MSADQDYSGDYGYDLAHEMRAGADGASSRPRSTVWAGMSVVPFEVDPHGDLGYDSAHEG
jgi:hypothetical protein